MKNIKHEVIHFFLGVEDLNDEAEEVRRLSICESCEVFNQDTRQCDEAKGGCGCFMDVKVKLKTNKDGFFGKIVKTHCPMGKWGQDDKKTANLYRKKKGMELL